MHEIHDIPLMALQMATALRLLASTPKYNLTPDMLRPWEQTRPSTNYKPNAFDEHNSSFPPVERNGNAYAERNGTFTPVARAGVFQNLEGSDLGKPHETPLSQFLNTRRGASTGLSAGRSRFLRSFSVPSKSMWAPKT